MSKTSRVTLSPIVENGQDTDKEFEFGEDYESSFSIANLLLIKTISSNYSEQKLNLESISHNAVDVSKPKFSKLKMDDSSDDDVPFSQLCEKRTKESKLEETSSVPSEKKRKNKSTSKVKCGGETIINFTHLPRVSRESKCGGESPSPTYAGIRGNRYDVVS